MSRFRLVTSSGTETSAQGTTGAASSGPGPNPGETRSRGGASRRAGGGAPVLTVDSTTSCV